MAERTLSASACGFANAAVPQVRDGYNENGAMPVWLLAVDTSSKQASVALMRDAELVRELAPPSEEQHSVQLFRLVEQLLADAGLTLRDVDAYGVANGPGAFTALRIGLAVVKGLAEMHRKPIVPVGVLQAVCEGASASGLLLPIVDAYREQIFGGLYEKAGSESHPRSAERVLTLEEFLASVAADGIRPDACTLVGPQLERWAAQFDASGFRAARRENVSAALAGAVARCALRKFGRGETVDALHLEANYVRRSDAELLWKPK